MSQSGIHPGKVTPLRGKHHPHRKDPSKRKSQAIQRYQSKKKEQSRVRHGSPHTLEGLDSRREITAVQKYSKAADVMWDMEIHHQPTREEHHVQTNAPGKMPRQTSVATKCPSPDGVRITIPVIYAAACLLLPNLTSLGHDTDLFCIRMPDISCYN